MPEVSMPPVKDTRLHRPEPEGELPHGAALPRMGEIDLHMLETITDNFSEERKISSGRYGDVYKGLYNGEGFSVIKLRPLRGLDDEAFDNELRYLTKIHHPNVVGLIGYLTMERALCLEYVQGGSLGKHISDRSCDLDWPTCYRIIKGTCEGLNHLHSALGKPTFLLELKPANILLDKNLTAKIKLISLSRFVYSPKTHKTGILQGTKYMPPEYIIDGTISQKVDVFSLGVLIVKIMSGYEGYYLSHYLSPKEFVELVTKNWKERMQGTWGHSSQEINILEVKVCVDIALRCVHADPNRRPYIKDIIIELEELEFRTKKIRDGSNGEASGARASPLFWAMESPLKPPTIFVGEEGRRRKKKRGKEDRREKEGRRERMSPSARWLAPQLKKVSLHSDQPKDEIGLQTMELNILERIVAGSEEPNHLDLSLLQSVTDNFSEKKRIGVGGCGEVYKGILQNGFVAVKRLFKSRTIKDKMFHREVKSLIAVRHQNIVRFLGYCSLTEERVISYEGGTIMVDIRERLLCFEYIRNGSLEGHITDELRGLEWRTRCEIILGICKGLLYLHKEKDIIHMDLKPANILLDDDLVPKITDFGLSRLDNNSQTTTTSRLISPGYCAPEYLLEGKSSSKSDIYSLGVIIVEVVTGSKKKMPNITKVIRRWRYRWIKSSEHSPLSYQQVTKCLELAQRCTQYDPKARPDISGIMDELNKIDSKEDQFQVTPFLEDMLGIEPLEIHFPSEELEQQIWHSIELTNDTDDYFAFITTTKLRRLRTEPEKGVVPPRSKCIVTVTMMQAQVMTQPNTCYKEKITVLSTRVDGGLAAIDIIEDMFIDDEGKVVDEVNVMVVLGKPPSAEEP